jgi:ATP-dependent Clp protease protease subunit
MTKTAEKAELKALDLRQKRAETLKAELETKQEKLRLSRQRRDWKKFQATDAERLGIFHFAFGVSADNCFLFAERLQAWSRQNPGAPLTIYLSTYGGDVLAGFGLYDTIRALSKQGHHVTTVVRGYAASFGAVLLQAGDVRIVGPESRIMLHEVSSGAFGKLHEIKDQADFIEKLNLRIFEVIAERAGVEGQSGRDLYRWAKAKDRWLTASACLERGFADEIG